MVCKYCIENIEEVHNSFKKHCYKKQECCLTDMKMENEYELKWKLNLLPDYYQFYVLIDQYYLSPYERYRKTVLEDGRIVYEHFFKFKMSLGWNREFSKEIDEQEYLKNKVNQIKEVSKIRFYYDMRRQLSVDVIKDMEGYFCEREFDSYSQMEGNPMCPFSPLAPLVKSSNYDLVTV